jgi:pyrroloquinoline quinone biosynthesis protein E
MIAFAEQLRPDRMEIAHAQYYGWALKNRDSLMPTRRQLESCLRIVGEAQVRLSGRVRIDCVVPDYYARYPKACMGGWGRSIMLINPAGEVLPCHAAGVIPGIQFDNVRERPLEWIWEDSAAFQRFRGEQWMPEPCRSCERRTEDFGGCRCQAFLLTGDASATDPVCTLAPTHHLIESFQLENKSEERSEEVAWSYRRNPAIAGRRVTSPPPSPRSN